MKKVVIAVVALGFVLGSLYAQPKDELRKELKQMQVELQGDLADMPGGSKMIVKINKDLGLDTDSADAAYLGIFVEDVTFPKAQELNYKGNIGVLVTGVVQESPAWQSRISEDDIILTLGGKEATNLDVFEKIRKQYRAGDAIKMDIFRSGEIITIDFTFGSRQTKAPLAPGEKPAKEKLSVGYGGGSWVPLWFDTDMEDINSIITQMGFGKLNEDGILMQGGAGKGHVGKGYFLGGAVYGYEDSRKILEPIAGSQYQIWMSYRNTMGGVTLDKRFALSKNIITSVGLMLGGASHTVEVLKSNANYDWNDWDTTLLNRNNTHSLVSRSYIIAQPKAELMVRLLPWFGLRAEGGYTYGYAPKGGWRVKGLNDENFEVLNSPDTEYQGYTVTVGPWFGF
ncbi:MAG: PDZ domain-containing protein [Candidatus Cloacimonetes bacterium]|nr:PDZ domain-containing protein [Candidatus Cloacimonadota bacterium]